MKVMPVMVSSNLHGSSGARGGGGSKESLSRWRTWTCRRWVCQLKKGGSDVVFRVLQAPLRMDTL
jgi:hypothetical protein